jgi:hypothetical protein
MNIFVFCLAAILSSPKQFITVYLGVLLSSKSNATTGTKQGKLVSDSVVGATALVTGLAMWWILRKMGQVKPKVIYDRRKARQAKLARAGTSPYSNPDAFVSSQTVGFNPRSSESHVPLTSGEYGMAYQKWDKDGHAVGYTGDPQLYGPQPQRAIAVGRMPIKRDEDSEGYNYSHGVRHGRSPVQQESDDSHDGSETELAYTIAPPGIPAPGTSSDKVRVQVHHPPTVMAGSLSLPVPYPVTQEPPSRGRPGELSAPPNFDQSASDYFVHAGEASDATFYTAHTAHSRGGSSQTST